MATKKPATKTEPQTETTAEESSVVVVDGVDGLKHYAWRRDGQRPVINLDDFARNRHSALAGELPADFADTVGPQ